MKTVILAGGRGTRISEEGNLSPKPMVKIGEFPILWHIMKYYTKFGHNEFIICSGYNGYFIKEYFAQYYLHASDVTFDFTKNNEMTIHNNVAEPWKVTIVDTGLDAQTGCRIKRIQKYVGDETFFLTYGDGVSNIDLNALLKQHQESDDIITTSVVKPVGRFGVMEIDENSDKAISFREKSQNDTSWINGGFMVANKELFDYVKDDENCILEREPLETICQKNQMGVYKHNGFWQCMDTQRDRFYLEKLWLADKAPWKIW